MDTFEDITEDDARKGPGEGLLQERGQELLRGGGGTITVRRRGGGATRAYRIIDFKRDKDGIPAKVASIEYDPNRSSRIALLHYADGEKALILAPVGLKVGSRIMSGPEADILPGNCVVAQEHPVRHPGA